MKVGVKPVREAFEESRSPSFILGESCELQPAFALCGRCVVC